MALPYMRNEAGIFICRAPVTDEAELVSAVFRELRIPMREVFGEEE